MDALEAAIQVRRPAGNWTASSNDLRRSWEGYHMKNITIKAAWPLYLLALVIGMGMAL